MQPPVGQPLRRITGSEAAEMARYITEARRSTPLPPTQLAAKGLTPPPLGKDTPEAPRGQS